MTQTLLYLSRQDVERVALPMAEIIDGLASAFLEKAHGRTEVPPKPGIHPRPDSFLHAMPALVPAENAAGIKWVAGFPDNPAKGLPYISGLLILNDPATGLPISVMDCTWITAKRTGAASALGAMYLARKDSAVMGICGCGVQARSHLEAFRVVLPGLRQVLCYDVSAEAQDRFVAEMTASFPDLEVRKAATAEAAVREADVVVTAANILREPRPTIQKGWLRPGSFASAVDFDCYWTREALDEVDLAATDDQGQLAYYRSMGFFPHLREAHQELAELVSGQVKGRTAPQERTMAIFLGLAIEDMVTGVRILERARRLGIGTELPL
jgi:ornithine cyclodeaminase/alanine dehydrogenase